MNGNFVRAHQTSQAAPTPIKREMTANARTLLRNRVESGDPLHALTPDFCRSKDRGAGIGPTLPNGSSPHEFAAKAMLAERRSPWTTEPRFAIPNAVLHGGGNKFVEAGLTVQVNYAFIGIKGDRSFLKKWRHVFIVADDLEMSESIAQPVNRRGLLHEHRRSLR
jgi:hypothetical protein